MEKLANGVYKLTFGQEEKHTPAQLLQVAPRIDALREKSDSATFPFSESDITFRTMPSGCVITLPMAEEERIYGFGLQMKSFMQNGKKKTVRCNADPVTDAGDAHAPVPMYVSERNYALYVDTYRSVSFYCGCAASKAKDQVVKVNEVLGDRFDNLYGKNKQPSDMIIHVPVAQGVTIYLIAGESMLDCVERYNLLSGGGFVPPISGLAALYRYYWRGTDEELIEQAKLLRSDGMPVSVIGLEPNWQSHSYSCSYRWNEKNFPAHGKMLSELRQMKFSVNAWEQAFVDPTADIFEELKPYSGEYFVWNGLVPDFFDPRAREIFCKTQQNLIDQGIGGFKMDECDGSEMYSYHFSFPYCDMFPSGIDGEQYHNAIGISMQTMQNELFHKNGIRTFGPVRASHAFAAHQPFVLYSDLYDHHDFMRALANSGFCGLLWTPETRFVGGAKELIRRIELGVLSAQVCINAYQIPYFPWYQPDFGKNVRGEFAADKEQTTETVRRILELRTRLIPYLYACFYKYYLYGTPPFRALALEYISDPTVTDIYDQLLIGDSIMAAPILDFESDCRNIYLPRGVWYEMFTGKRYEGGAWIENYCARIDEIPLFVRENSLIPLARPQSAVTDGTEFTVDFKLFGKSASCDLYEDDGRTFGYEKGEYSRWRVSAENGRLTADRYGSADFGRYKFGRLL